MKRIIAIVLGLTLGAVLLGCGGGSPVSTADPTNGTPQASRVVPAAPDQVIGDHATTFLPNKLNVLSGSSESDLQSVVAKFGYTVEFKDGGWASVGVPVGTDLDQAVVLLEKEYSIISAAKVQQVVMPRPVYSAPINRSASFIPLDPAYSDQFVGYGGVTTNPDDATDEIIAYNTFFGQGLVMNAMGFEGAWDLSDPLNIRGDVANQPVRVAIIDAGWVDYSTEDRPGFDETLLDTDATTGCGAVAGDGTFTPGLAAVEWETFVEQINTDPPLYSNTPLRGAGELMLGIVGASVNDYTPRAVNVDDDDPNISDDEIWNEGIAGINPNATFILLKTGSASGETWTFTDQQIAAAINRAWNEADADIILLGMATNGAMPANVQTAIQSARDNGALVIAPAGDVIDSFNGAAAPPFFDDPVFDITVTTFWPASDPNCLSVTGTGVDRTDTLPDLNFGGNVPPVVPNVGRGWWPAGFVAPFDEPFFMVTNYCNTGADIAAVGYGIGFGLHPNLIGGGHDGSAGDPYQFILGDTLSTRVNSFGTLYAAAYVAGAASIVHQALQFNGGVGDPNDYDDNVEAALLDTASFQPLDNVGGGGGFLNANLAIQQGFNGAQLFVPGMSLSGLGISQPLGAVTRGTPFSFTPAVASGTAPFTISVDWGTGDPLDNLEDAAWNNGDPVELTAGFDKIGPTGVSFSITDSKNQIVGAGMELIVMNPLAINITIENSQGSLVAPTAVKTNTDYRFRANPTNLYTGDIGGTPNTITYSWDFNGDGTEDATGASPGYKYTGTGTFTIELTVTESARPNDSPWTRAVTVIP